MQNLHRPTKKKTAFSSPLYFLHGEFQFNHILTIMHRDKLISHHFRNPKKDVCLGEVKFVTGDEFGLPSLSTRFRDNNSYCLSALIAIFTAVFSVSGWGNSRERDSYKFISLEKMSRKFGPKTIQMNTHAHLFEIYRNHFLRLSITYQP